MAAVIEKSFNARETMWDCISEKFFTFFLNVNINYKENVRDYENNTLGV